MQFSKEKCEVLNSKKELIMTGTWHSDNCYHWNNKLENLKCNLSKSDETMLWHKHLGHVSISKICKTLKAEDIHGVSLLKHNSDNFYSQCSKSNTLTKVETITELVKF